MRIHVQQRVLLPAIVLLALGSPVRAAPTAALIVPAYTTAAAGVSLSPGEVVNTASLQRMLVQRLVKSYLMLSQQVAVDEARSQRTQAIALYENNLRALQVSLAQGQAAQDILQRLSSQWPLFRDRIKAKPDLRTAAEIIRQGEALLKLQEELVTLTSDQLNVSHLTQIDGRQIAVMSCNLACLSLTRRAELSARQQMLTQRIASLYLAKSGGVAYPGLDSLFNKAIAQYESGLEQLADDPDNNEAVVQSLRRLRISWGFARKGLGLSNNDLFVPVVICGMADKQLLRIQAISRSYEEEIQHLAENDKRNPSA